MHYDCGLSAHLFACLSVHSSMYVCIIGNVMSCRLLEGVFVRFAALMHLGTEKIDWILTLSLPIPLRLYTLPYWSNTLFLIFDTR